MKMASLLEKYRHYEAIIKAREDDYVYDFLNGKDVPLSVFQVYPNGRVKELKIEDIIYQSGKQFWFNKKPTRKVVEEIKLFAEEKYEFSSERISVRYSETFGEGRSSGGFKYSEIDKYLTREQAEEKSKALIAAREAEEELIKAGTHFRCERCRKVSPNESKVKHNIIGRSRDRFGKSCLTNEPMIFCSGTCAGHEQMSREG